MERELWKRALALPKPDHWVNECYRDVSTATSHEVFCGSGMRILCTFLEGSQRDLLLAVDFEEGVQPRDLKEVRHSFVDLGKFHLASPLPDDAIASDEFAHAIAVYVIHSGEIEQEFLVAGVGEDVYQVTQLRATITQREFANSVNYNDSVELSCGDLKTHGDLARLCFPARNHTSRGLGVSTRLHLEPSQWALWGYFDSNRFGPVP